MRSSLLLLWAGALILAAANPTPQSGGTFRCPPLASTGDTETPPIIIGDLVIPTVAIDGTDTGGTSRLVCCRAGTAGVLALPSGTCVDGLSSPDGTCPSGTQPICCGALVLAPPPLPIIGQTGVIYSLCEPPIRG